MSRRLLVTDDAIIIREIIKDAAGADGWTIVGEASNGDEAVQQYRLTSPDAMTLDMVMPQYDGLYALEEIRKLDSSAVIVVVSALDQRPILEQAFRLGAADFVIKPFDRDLLISTLGRLVPAEAVPSP